ncbi:hypothetical protein GGR54DRAFT_554422 [Hypoxylon sp. NC1633]|nr:hypothetical protein GGR54DRAFT_554422 [Hypoxylon sp. NC1633]
MEALRGTSPSKNSTAPESPEQLLDAFKAAALSVTKLYKTSAAAQARARADGFQDCLDELLLFLDKSNIGLGDGEGWQIRKWATERLEGRDAASQSIESEDEAEKSDPTSSPEIHRSNNQYQNPTMRNEGHMQPDAVSTSAPQASNQSSAEETQIFAVPTQENFTFRSSHPYPELYPNLENLDLSDSTRGSNDNATPTSSAIPITHAARSRSNRRGARLKPTNHLGKGAGQKRAINYAELFDVSGTTFGKDVFGREGKRTRHT